MSNNWEYYEPRFEKMLQEQDRELCFLDAPRYVTEALLLLSRLLPPAQYNPFDNTASVYKSRVFAVRSFSWSDDEQPWNFAWQDVRIRWYKYLGRGMIMNKIMFQDDVIDMMVECLESLRTKDADDAS